MPQSIPQLSADGAWWWTGNKWTPAKSADGRWRWDGSAWQPLPQPVPLTSTNSTAPAPAHASHPAHTSADGHWQWDGRQWLSVAPPAPVVSSALQRAPAPAAVPDPVAALMPHTPHRRAYRLVLGLGLALLVGLSILVGLSGGALIIVLPLIIIGAFLVPVVYVAYMREIDAFSGIPWSLLLKIGGATALIALPSAAFLEIIIGAHSGSLIPAFGVGLIEEGLKIAVLLWFVRRCKFRFELDGVVFGAAAGMAFASFENVAYFFTFGGASTAALLLTVWLRVILGPFGHGTWTASIAAVIWRERFNGPGKLDRKVLWAYLTSSALHGLWDFAPALGLLAIPWTLAVGVISILVLRQRIRQALGPRRAAPGPPLPAPQLLSAT